MGGYSRIAVVGAFGNNVLLFGCVLCFGLVGWWRVDTGLVRGWWRVDTGLVESFLKMLIRQYETLIYVRNYHPVSYAHTIFMMPRGISGRFLVVPRETFGGST